MLLAVELFTQLENGYLHHDINQTINIAHFFNFNQPQIRTTTNHLSGWFEVMPLGIEGDIVVIG